MSLIVKQLSLGPMQNFSYLLGSDVAREVVVIDPGWEGERIQREAAALKCRLTGILLTHGHYDHVQEVGALQKALAIPVYCHPDETYSLDRKVTIRPVGDGGILKVAGAAVQCIGTPGHSPAAICYYIGKFLFTGDTLFVGACGRVDLPGSDPQQLVESLQKLAALPDETVVLPGHDYGPTPTSTIGREKKTNPHMKFRLG